MCSVYLWNAVFLDASIMGDLGTDPAVRSSVRITKLISSLIHSDNRDQRSYGFKLNLLDYLLWVVGLVAVDQLVGLHLGHVEHGEGVGVGVDVQHSHVALRHLTMHWMEKSQRLNILETYLI